MATCKFYEELLHGFFRCKRGKGKGKTFDNYFITNCKYLPTGETCPVHECMEINLERIGVV